MRGDLLLKWDDIDRTTRVLHLRDTKTGPRMVPLTGPVLKVLDGIEREECVRWVLRGTRPGSRLASLSHHLQRIRTETGLGDLRIHDLPHSFASRALSLGETLHVIGKLLGHSNIGTTARYAHLAQESIHETAQRIAGSIAADVF